MGHPGKLREACRHNVEGAGLRPQTPVARQSRVYSDHIPRFTGSRVYGFRIID